MVLTMHHHNLYPRSDYLRAPYLNADTRRDNGPCRTAALARSYI